MRLILSLSFHLNEIYFVSFEYLFPSIYNEWGFYNKKNFLKVYFTVNYLVKM